MRLFIYNVLLSLLGPPARWWVSRHRVYAPLRDRFAPPIPSNVIGALWVQVCSLGEANAARPLVEALREAFPERPVLVTSSTLSGYTRCQALYGSDTVAWFPVDTQAAVQYVLTTVRPAALILFETELWPNVLEECRRAHVPVLLANGRLSDKHQKRYERFRWWYGPLVRHLDGACMQEEIYASRLEALGVPAERIVVTGNVKFDAVRTAISARERNAIRQEWGFRDEDVLLLFACTRSGDDALASACWATLRDENPRLKIIIAPRHLDHMEEVLEPFSEAVIRKTEMKGKSPSQSARVFILDTLGELDGLYALARVAVIGGSFYPGVNGHNPLEAAALGVPTIFGPYMSNFAHAQKVLVDAGGAKQVACPEDLYLALSTLLADQGKVRQMGTAARRAVMENQGASEKTVAHLRTLLDN